MRRFCPKIAGRSFITYGRWSGRRVRRSKMCRPLKKRWKKGVTLEKICNTKVDVGNLRRSCGFGVAQLWVGADLAAPTGMGRFFDRLLFLVLYCVVGSFFCRPATYNPCRVGRRRATRGGGVFLLY